MQAKPSIIIALVLMVLIVGATVAGCFQGRVIPSANLPVISHFAASPDSISPGGTATMSWTVSNASSVSIDNGIGGVALSGNRSIAPTTTTLYTLTAKGPGGSNIATVQVLVASTAGPSAPSSDIPTLTPTYVTGLPLINFFTEDAVTFSTHTLSWNVSNATEVSITPGIGAVAAAGSRTVTPAKTTTYTLSANNAYGLSQKTVTVNIVSATGSISTPLLIPAVPFNAKPDLVVDYCIKDGDKLKFRVKNIGGDSFSKSNFVLQVIRGSTSFQEFPGIPAGGTSTEFIFNDFTCSPGNPKTVKIEVDVSHTVDESNEDNNILSKTFCQ